MKIASLDFTIEVLLLSFKEIASIKENLSYVVTMNSDLVLIESLGWAPVYDMLSEESWHFNEYRYR